VYLLRGKVHRHGQTRDSKYKARARSSDAGGQPAKSVEYNFYVFNRRVAKTVAIGSKPPAPEDIPVPVTKSILRGSYDGMLRASSAPLPEMGKIPAERHDPATHNTVRNLPAIARDLPSEGGPRSMWQPRRSSPSSHQELAVSFRNPFESWLSPFALSLCSRVLPAIFKMMAIASRSPPSLLPQRIKDSTNFLPALIR
jgi:hypothetical protein